MTPKMISADAVIAKVSSDFDLGGTDWVPHAYEWIGFALQAIGGLSNLQRVKEKVLIKNHRVSIPCSMVHLRAIDFNGKQLMQSTSKRHMTFTQTTPTDDRVFNTEFPLLDTDDQNITVAGTFNTTLINTSNGEYYYMTPDTMVFSMTGVEVDLHYDAVALDEHGYPLIPDSYQHQEAIAFYILYKYLSRGNTHPAWNIQAAKQEWEKMLHQAYNRGVAPTLADMQNFQNAWNRIIFDHTSIEKFSEDLGNKQFNRNI